MIILFGPAGSGKSLQGQKLSEKYGWRWMSVGQMLRECADEEMQQVMKEGKLVDDNFVVKMMHGAMVEELNAGRNGILDGYPRNQWQANWIVENGDEKYFDGVIVLDVDHEELYRRLMERGRADDTKEAIQRRWELFESTIGSMSETLASHGVKIEHVDGVGEVDAVTARIEEKLRGWGVIE